MGPGGLVLTDFMKTDSVVLGSGYRREKNVKHTPITHVCTNASSYSIGKPDVCVWIDRNCAKSLIYMCRQNVMLEYVSI